VIILDPENIGCGRKVPPEQLEALQSTFADGLGRTIPASDHAAQALPHGEILLSSVDRTARFCSSNDVYVAGALSHAGNDVLVGGAVPDFVSASIGISRREFDADGGHNLVRALASRISAMGLSPGKLHSFIDYETSLTLAVSGKREAWQQQGS
jgi:hypothetical protein